MLINKIKTINSLIRRDFIYSLRKSLYIYFFIIVEYGIINVIILGSFPNKITGTDLFYEIFKGASNQVDINNFQFPLMWLMISSLIAFLIGNYTYNDLNTNGVYILIRIPNKMYFWITKIIWIILNVFTYYVVLFLITLLFSRLYNLTFPVYSLFDHTKINSTKFLFDLFILYFTSSSALAILQAALSLIIKPSNSYIAIIILISISAFISCNLLPGQHSSILRHIPFSMQHNLNITKSLIYNCVFAILSVVLGYRILDKKDIFK